MSLIVVAHIASATNTANEIAADCFTWRLYLHGHASRRAFEGEPSEGFMHPRRPGFDVGNVSSAAPAAVTLSAIRAPQMVAVRMLPPLQKNAVALCLAKK
jgi:hypothetical protein